MSAARSFARKYGIKGARFFTAPDRNFGCSSSTRAEHCSERTSKLRQAVNFAVDRKALLRERGPLAGTLTDQYLPPFLPGFKNERIYPLKAPDVKKAKQLAKGHTRSGKAVLYIRASVGRSPRRRSSRTT